MSQVRCAKHSGDRSSRVDACDECLALAEAADAEEVASGAIDWAESVDVTVEPLPDDLRRRAEAHYAANGHERPPGGNGLEAYVRHHWSNYEALLRALEERFPTAQRRGLAYGALRDRVDAAVHDALDDLQARSVGDDD